MVVAYFILSNVSFDFDREHESEVKFLVRFDAPDPI